MRYLFLVLILTLLVSPTLAHARLARSISIELNRPIPVPENPEYFNGTLFSLDFFPKLINPTRNDLINSPRCIMTIDASRLSGDGYIRIPATRLDLLFSRASSEKYRDMIGIERVALETVDRVFNPLIEMEGGLVNRYGLNVGETSYAAQEESISPLRYIRCEDPTLAGHMSARQIQRTLGTKFSVRAAQNFNVTIGERSIVEREDIYDQDRGADVWTGHYQLNTNSPTEPITSSLIQ